MGKDRFKYCCIIVTWASGGIFEALDRPSPIAEAKWLMGKLCNLVDSRERMKLVLFLAAPLTSWSPGISFEGRLGACHTQSAVARSRWSSQQERGGRGILRDIPTQFR